MTFTAEQIATLHTLMTDHAAQEMLVSPARSNTAFVWLYDSDDGLVATACVDELGTIKTFDFMGTVR
jgi:hypothetical protein